MLYISLNQTHSIMNKKEAIKTTREQLAKLSEELIALGIRTGDSGIMLVGTMIMTGLDASQNERAEAELNLALQEFCIRQIKRSHGMSEGEIAIDELFRQKVSLN